MTSAPFGSAATACRSYRGHKVSPEVNYSVLRHRVSYMQPRLNHGPPGCRAVCCCSDVLAPCLITHCCYVLKKFIDLDLMFLGPQAQSPNRSYRLNELKHLDDLKPKVCSGAARRAFACDSTGLLRIAQADTKQHRYSAESP